MNRAGSNKIIGVILIVVTIGLYFFGGFYYFGMFGGYLPLLTLIAGIVLFFIKDKEQKLASGGKPYKQQQHSGRMKLEYLFYIIGVIFIFASVWYFVHEFIALLPNMIKLILLFVSIIVSFIVAEFMRGAEI